jgi:general secretion pathway protein G
MTLIEIMVVIAIIGMIMGAVAVAVVARTKKAKEGTARIKAQKVYEAAAEFYISAPPGTGCPTLEDLIQAEVIKAAQTKDDWGREFEIRCEGDVVSEVRSAGADGNPGNDDDIVFSEQQEEER